jgi:hypothetical protein
MYRMYKGLSEILSNVLVFRCIQILIIVDFFILCNTMVVNFALRVKVIILWQRQPTVEIVFTYTTFNLRRNTSL